MTEAQGSHPVRGVVPTSAERGFYRIARAVLVGACRAWFRLRVEGSHHLPEHGPVILAPVHRSNLDTPIVAATTRRMLRFMGKDSLWARSRAIGAVLSALGAFPVARGTADREALRRCQEVLESGQPLVLFPEGTRRSGPIVEDIFDGPAFLALRTGAPIVPIGIAGSEEAQPRGGRWIRPIRVHVVIGAPLVPTVGGGSTTSRRAVRELTATLQEELQRLFEMASDRRS
ncbi:MAG: 1-acyl-sn-glycerol-3-phosphate acyltransferase [Actinobacteria bacterium]|nr:1-acyl-sn-glycerol-3-phosphate acyltransferase [Actinomycetota bacterium]